MSNSSSRAASRTALESVSKISVIASAGIGGPFFGASSLRGTQVIEAFRRFGRAAGFANCRKFWVYVDVVAPFPAGCGVALKENKQKKITLRQLTRPCSIIDWSFLLEVTLTIYTGAEFLCFWGKPLAQLPRHSPRFFPITLLPVQNFARSSPFFWIKNFWV